MTWAPIIPTMPRLTRLPIAGRMTGLTLLDRQSILTSVISTETLTGNDRQEGQYRLTVMATHTRLTRTVSPASRHRAIRG